MNNSNKNKKLKKPWPTKNAMEQVYEMKLWGDNNTDFYSGDGSHNSAILAPYITVVKSFLKSFEKKLIICDLGCGDFNVGKELVQFSKKYFAIDIVENLIHRNKVKFNAENLEFHCLDISKDKLPSGDCIILRQVLQHLSNGEVSRILTKFSNFKYIILTEHLPNADFIPNKDIISGQGIRLKKQSGLNILMPPFNLKVKEEEQLLSTVLKDSKGVIVTTLYQLF
ncbi:class I SAM-dependent methyltransferase [Polaribacter haliotis]|uniref:Class I SAM-dependent methyltransferase n=1 Tax=Polaribacter haliotis TaxID=1888915 RepID=A0A7L8AIC9_9FLAO|nr:methyltransferase domain-containing protein [Polaribacter haliotis]QOD61758.1 class I SAM-dependent methyltransferase [Polaribacter haliotis]